MKYAVSPSRSVISYSTPRSAVACITIDNSRKSATDASIVSGCTRHTHNPKHASCFTQSCTNRETHPPRTHRRSTVGNGVTSSLP